MISYSIICDGAELNRRRDAVAPQAGDIIVLDEGVYKVANRGFDFQVQRDNPIESRLQINVEKMGV